MIKFRFLFLALLLAGVGGCGREGVKYNNSVAKVSKDIESIGKNMGDAMAQNQGNHQKQKEIHAKAVADVSKVIQEGRAIAAPGVTQGKEFHQAFQEFLTETEKLFRDDMGQILTLTSQQKQGEAIALAQRIDQKEKTIVQNLRNAQSKFAQANNFKIQ